MNASTVRAILHICGRLIAKPEDAKALLFSSDTPIDTTEIREVSRLTDGLPAVFTGYTPALVYNRIWGNLAHFSRHMLDLVDANDLRTNTLVPMEVNLEKQNRLGVEINLLADPQSYQPPLEERMDQVLDRLVATQTNVIPGGSDEIPVEYQAQMTEGMRLYDIWGITNAHIVGKHPFVPNGPLYLHVALERSGDQPPIYAYFNIRTNKLSFQLPLSGWQSTPAELHLLVYALITDLRNFERSGISIREGDEYTPHPGEKLHTPIKRYFVIGKSGIQEHPKEPTGYKDKPASKTTLPYGSQLVKALEELRLAIEEKNEAKIEIIQREVNKLKARLPKATKENMKKYREKAAAFGLGENSIVVREGRITEAPRQPYRLPIHTQNPPMDRIIRVVPSHGSQELRVNELFSAPDNVDVVFSDEEQQEVTEQSNEQTDEFLQEPSPSSEAVWRRALRRFRLGRRDVPPIQ